MKKILYANVPLWKRHSEEMQRMEGNIFQINNGKVTFSFVPVTLHGFAGQQMFCPQVQHTHHHYPMCTKANSQTCKALLAMAKKSSGRCQRWSHG